MTEQTNFVKLELDPNGKFPILTIEHVITPSWFEWLQGFRTIKTPEKFIKYEGGVWRSFPFFQIVFRDGYPGFELLDYFLDKYKNEIGK